MKIQNIAIRVRFNPEAGGWTWWVPHTGETSTRPKASAEEAAADAKSVLDTGGRGSMDLDTATPTTRWYVLNGASYCY